MWKKTRKMKLEFNAEKIFLASELPMSSVFSYFQTAPQGLNNEEVEKRQSLYGRNEVEHEKKMHPLTMLIKAFINPFIGVLTALIIISYIIDVYIAAPEEKDFTSIIIIASMVILSTILRFWQEYKASMSSEALQKMVTNTCTAKRDDGTEHEIGISSLVPGDIVKLAAGDMIPADIRIIETKDLFVSQGTLTGESEAIEKRAEASGGDSRGRSIVELENICFMGSNVVSGSATGIVVSTSNNTYLGTIARSIAGHRASTAFDKGIAKVSMLLIRFMLIMVPFVFLVNGLTKGEWLDAFLFAVSTCRREPLPCRARRLL